MSRLSLALPVILVAGLVCGCATSGPTASVPSSYVGASIDDFKAQYGAPSQVTALEDGSTLARFYLADSRTGPSSVPGAYTPRWERSRVPTTSRPQFVGSAHGETGSGVTLNGQSARYQMCAVDVTVSAEGLVETVSTERETCNHITR